MKNLVFFILCAVIIMAPICVINKKQMKLALKDEVFVFGDSVTILISGDSHTKTVLDPDIIKSSVNISQDAETYPYTYLKLRHFLDMNPQIRTVVLGFNYHSISKQIEHKFFDSSSSFDTFYPLITDEMMHFIKDGKKNYTYDIARYDIGLRRNGIGMTLRHDGKQNCWRY